MERRTHRAHAEVLPARRRDEGDPPQDLLQ